MSAQESLNWLMHRQDGVLSRRQAPHRGIVVAHNGPLSPRQRQWVAVLAAGAGRAAYLGGLSALLVLGLKNLTSRHIHVLLPARCRENNPPPGVVVHRTRSLPPRDRWRQGCPPCTTAPRSVVDAAQWAQSDSEARLIVASSFQQRLVHDGDIDDVVARMPRAYRRSLILRTAADAQGGSGTLAEIDLISLCRRFGLPLPTRQVPRLDARGRVRYLDAYWEDWKLHVEIDGSHHMSVEHWWADMSRQNELWIAGERVLRFPAWLVRERPREVLAQIRAALIAAGWVSGL